jgi:hypothetical protein
MLELTFEVNYSKDPSKLFFAVMTFCNLPAKDAFRYGHILTKILQIDVAGVKCLPTTKH